MKLKRIIQKEGIFIVFFFLLPTGLAAQAAYSLPDTTRSSWIEPDRYASGFTPKKLILPLSLIGVGAVGTAIDNMNDFHLFSRKESVKQIRIDDYLEWGMLGWVFICDLMGKEKHSWQDQLFLVMLAEGMNAGMVHGIKKGINERRPDGGPHSFPSGHTVNSFLGAHIAYKEFKDTNPWLAYSGYGIATFVGVSRLYNNRHWVSDVLAGAGFGILSVELAYLIYFPVRNKLMNKFSNKVADKLMISPSFNQHGGGLYMGYSF
ncbi:MAG: phosphatase PAP2 family protein [Tannerellaceae bacterium]|nr:phosphatase PAP2 family protein [Tannerellaceae bacterium]